LDKTLGAAGNGQKQEQFKTGENGKRWQKFRIGRFIPENHQHKKQEPKKEQTDSQRTSGLKEKEVTKEHEPNQNPILPAQAAHRIPVYHRGTNFRDVLLTPIVIGRGIADRYICSKTAISERMESGNFHRGVDV